jgi:hypothetical protein
VAEALIRQWLSMRALDQMRALGHVVPAICWEGDGQEGSGTCTRCGDGVVLYYTEPPDACAIEGTAYRTPCPGQGCAHGWRRERRAGVGLVLACVHCGAERTESEEIDRTAS